MRKKLTRIGLALLAAGLAVLVIAWPRICVPEFPARGAVAGVEMTTSVDHPLAVNYLQGEALPPDLQELREAILRKPQELKRSTFRSIANQFSPDIATLLLLEAFEARSDDSRLTQRYRESRAQGSRNDLLQAYPRLHILFAPG